MLTLQVFWKKDRIYAQHSESKNSGGLLAAVYPGGSFMGHSFEALARMGSGEHDVATLDPHDFRNTGQEPVYESLWRSEVARFEFILFGYQVGAYTALEVLNVANQVNAEAGK